MGFRFRKTINLGLVRLNHSGRVQFVQREARTALLEQPQPGAAGRSARIVVVDESPE